MATTNTTTTTAMTNLSREYLKAFNSHDVEKILSFYTDEGILEDVGSGVVYRGKPELRNYYSQLFKIYPDTNMEFKTDFGAGDWQSTEWVSVGTHRGNIPAQGNLPEIRATNKRVSVKGLSMVQRRGDKILRQTLYWDMASLMQQLGLMQPVGLVQRRRLMLFRIAAAAVAIAATYFMIVAALAAAHLI